VIPLRLTLSNFMCYGENVPPLQLDGVRVACLCGENGAGKSTLLDAITWALWGKARARSLDDELIRQNSSEMAVELEFQVLGNVYRVVRKRSRSIPKHPGHTVLELQLVNGEGSRSVSADTVRETQRKIIDLLRMEYETFINSAFLMQGRADEFTLKAAGDRKQVLADILDLSMYDRLEGLAKEERDKCRQSKAVLEMSVRSLDAELARKPEYEKAVSDASSCLSPLEAQSEKGRLELEALQKERALLEHKGGQLKEIEQRKAQAEGELGQLRNRAWAHQAALDGFEKVLTQEAAVATGYIRLQEIVHVKEELDSKLRSFTEHTQRRNVLERAVELARTELVSQQRVLASQLKEAEPKWQSLGQKQLELDKSRVCLESLAETEKLLHEKRQSLEENSAGVAELKAANGHLHKEMLEIKAKMDQLGQGKGVCPLCSTPLGIDRCADITQSYQAQGMEKKALYVSNEAQAKQLETDVASLRLHVSQLEGQLKREQPALAAKVATLEKDVSEAKAAGEKLTALRTEQAALEKRLAAKDYAPVEMAELATLLHEIGQLGYDRVAHDDAIKKHDDLKKFEELHRRLEEARQRAPEEKTRLDESEAGIERWEKALVEESARQEALGKELAALPGLIEMVRASEQALAKLTREVQALQQELGAARRNLDRLAEVERSRKEKLAELNLASEEQGLYEELAAAFGKKGVQALIIEAAIPQIENEANRLLARMTDGRMHVKMETQRTTDKGKDVETLEIKIGDELGTRNYEMYSGGEAFRINLALRIGLSKLLARRSGAPLPVLFIDEGFGTQDAAGREKMVETINSIQDDFDKIIVITHIEELKEAFPVRIEVLKKPEGSMFWMN